MNITTLKQLQDAIAKASIASFTYRSKGSGKLARQTIQVDTNYLNMLQKNLLECSLLSLDDIDNPDDLPMRQGKARILKSLRKSIKAHKQGKQSEDYTKKHVYKSLGKGLTEHKKDNSIEIHGYFMKEKIIEQGIYKTVKSGKLVLAKNLIKKHLPQSKWRTFSFENLESAKLSGIELK